MQNLSCIKDKCILDLGSFLHVLCFLRASRRRLCTLCMQLYLTQSGVKDKKSYLIFQVLLGHVFSSSLAESQLGLEGLNETHRSTYDVNFSSVRQNHYLKKINFDL